jgi:hypothetical protein
MTPGAPPRAVVLVEGDSDKVALETLARRLDRDLAAEGATIVPIGGAQAIRGFLERFAPERATAGLAGLCDAGEARHWQRALERAGYGADLSRDEMERLGFYVCEADLEDELIRALGAAAVQDVLAAEGALGSFRTFQKQPAQQSRSEEAQLRRFMGTRSGRKSQYARLLVEALELETVPRPLRGVLTRIELLTERS